MLELSGITLSRDTFQLTADVCIDAGHRVALIGPSGAGKSTLLSVIAGFDTPDTGSVRWAGKDLSDLVPAKRPINIIFQDNNLFPHLSVSQNVGLGIHPGLRLSPDDERAISQSLSKVGLAGSEARRPAELSGGQQSRVVLARALIRQRPILLMDEPFSALGPALKAEMLDLVIDASEEFGLTVVLVTHDPADALRFAEDTAMVVNGIVHAPTPTKLLFENPPEDLLAYIGSSSQT